MKAVTIVFNIAIAEEVMDTVRKSGAKHFTQWPRVVGNGPHTGYRMDDHVWPGANSAVLVILEASLAVGLMDALQVLRDSPTGRQAGVFAYQSAVERALNL
jgi:hypothetical protein